MLLKLALALLIIQPQTVAASPAAPAPAPDLTVSGFYWGRVQPTVIDMSADFPRLPTIPRTRARRRLGPDATVLIQRETYALVRNVGKRKIKAVTWDYVFYDDRKREHEVRRFTFRTKETLAPGEMKFLTANVQEGRVAPYDDVVIERIEFDDGSSWDRSGAK
jgi:hypothetical protein